jgi:surfeit locus 1 family protein
MGRFRPGVKMTVAVVLLVPLTITLGFWQLHRAAEKRAIEAARLATYGTLPMDESHLDGAGEYTRFRLRGRFDGSRQFLVDNKIRHGVPGYLVMTPFETVGGKRVLIDRGWIAAPETRDNLPTSEPPTQLVSIVAMRWRDPTVPNTPDPWGDHWPKRVQFMDVQRMAVAVGGALPMELRLDEGQPGSLAQLVEGEEMTPTRHIAYAVQWFGMAVVLVVAFVAFGLRRKE